MYSCDACPRRATCRRICPEIEKLLPPADGRPRASLNAIGKSVAWSVQDREAELAPRRRLVARLYHRFGWPEARIARLLGVGLPAVCRMLKRIRKKIAKHGKKTA